jgi:hypothetical protein
MGKYGASHGVSKAAVTKWRKRGWLVFQGDKVNVEASNKNLKRYRSAGITEGQAILSGKTLTRAVDRIIEDLDAIDLTMPDLDITDVDITMSIKEARRIKRKLSRLTDPTGI